MKVYGSDCRYSAIDVRPTMIVSPLCQLSFLIPQTKFIQYVNYHLQRTNYERYMLFQLNFHIQKIENLPGALRINTFFEDSKQFSLEFDSNNVTSSVGDFNLPWVALPDLDSSHLVHLALVFEPLVEITEANKDELNFVEVINITAEYIHQPGKMELEKKFFVLESSKESNAISSDNQLPSCNWTAEATQSKCDLLGFPHSNALNGVTIGKMRRVAESTAGSGLNGEKKVPKVFCGIFTTADKHATKVKVS